MSDLRCDPSIDLGTIVRAFPSGPTQAKWFDRIGVVIEVVATGEFPSTPGIKGGARWYSEPRFVIKCDEGPPLIRRAKQVEVILP